MEILSSALVVLAVAIIVAARVAWVHRPGHNTMPPAVQDTSRTCDGCAEVDARVMQLEAQLQTVRAAVAEGISHVDRVEMRIQGAVKRARKELRDSGAEHPGLEAEAAELSLVHGDGGPSPSMPLMPQPVAESESSVRGVSPEQLRRVRGM